MRKVLARFNFSYNLIGNRPQCLTGHTATVSHYMKKHLGKEIKKPALILIDVKKHFCTKNIGRK